jgi:hypothetical protein
MGLLRFGTIPKHASTVVNVEAGGGFEKDFVCR